MKKIRVSLMFLILIIIANLSFADTSMNTTKGELSNKNSDSIVYANSSEVSPNEEFYLILDLSKITYTEFSVQITNTSNLQLVEVPEGISNVSAGNNVTTFKVNKNSIPLDKIGITYTAPLQSGSIEFEVIITSLDDNLTKWKAELNTINTEIDDLNAELTNLTNELNTISVEIKETEEVSNEIEEENIVDDNSLAEETEKVEREEIQNQIDAVNKLIEEKNNKKTELENQIKNYTQEIQTQKVIVTVVEESENTKNNQNEKLLEQLENGKMDNMLSGMQKMKEQVQELEGNLKNANDQINSLTATATYQGSQNNYLEALSISGVELKNAFKKTTQTYFATVDDSVTKLTVNATAEDSSAIVTIYGNTNLQSGQNKILINVTADDGSVRTYKIYVTK